MTMSRTKSDGLMKPDFLNERRSPDDLFEPEFEDTMFEDSEPPLFSDSGDIALQPFDLTSAVACDGTQSNLDLFLDSPTSLNARDLADEFPGLNDLVAPLNQGQDSSCRAPVGQQGGSSSPRQPDPSKGGGDKLNDLLAPLLTSGIETTLPTVGDCDGLSPLYKIPYAAMVP